MRFQYVVEVNIPKAIFLTHNRRSVLIFEIFIKIFWYLYGIKYICVNPFRDIGISMGLDFGPTDTRAKLKKMVKKIILKSFIFAIHTTYIHILAGLLLQYIQTSSKSVNK